PRPPGGGGRGRRGAGGGARPDHPCRARRCSMSRGWPVAVSGLGTRGLRVAERIVTLADQAGAAYGPIQVELIDPRGDGAGIHTTDQPDYLLLNTTASQVSMFPDA